MLGASGRMGQSIIGCITESEDFELSGAVTRPDDPVLGQDAGTVAGIASLGVTLTDDYAWLRAGNWQEAMRAPDKLPDDIKTYLEAENAYYDTAMADTADLQATLVAEMRGRIKEDDTSVPRKNGP